MGSVIQIVRGKAEEEGHSGAMVDDDNAAPGDLGAETATMDPRDTASAYERPDRLAKGRKVSHAGYG